MLSHEHKQALLFMGQLLHMGQLLPTPHAAKSIVWLHWSAHLLSCFLQFFSEECMVQIGYFARIKCLLCTASSWRQLLCRVTETECIMMYSMMAVKVYRMHSIRRIARC